MDLDTFKPTFLIQIEGHDLSADITQEITSFVFEDNEEELDVLELSVTDRNLQFVDDPLFQEGNEIVARFGYVGNLSPRKKAVIKDIDYDFPEGGDPTIRIKQNVEVKGVGLKFSGVYYCTSVRHIIGEGGYLCELKLKKNALGKGAGEKSGDAKGKRNENEAPPEPKEEPPKMVTIDADTGKKL